MKKVAMITIGVIATIAIGLFGFYTYFNSNIHNPDFFKSSIAEFEAEDKRNPPAAGNILFVGSSSIRFWETLQNDMDPLPVINRGFGGAFLTHVVHNFTRVVTPYRPTAIVVYAGENDFMGPAEFSSPEAVLAAFKQLIQLRDKHLAGTPLYYISIKPSLLRWETWPQMQQANTLIQQMINTDNSLHYFDVATAMLDDQGEVKDDIFVFDNLHLNDQGYSIWTNIIKPRLLQDFADNYAIVSDSSTEAVGN